MPWYSALFADPPKPRTKKLVPLVKNVAVLELNSNISENKLSVSLSIKKQVTCHLLANVELSEFHEKLTGSCADLHGFVQSNAIEVHILG